MVLAKLRSGSDLNVDINFSVTVNSADAGTLAAELRQTLQELGLHNAVKVEQA